MKKIHLTISVILICLVAMGAAIRVKTKSIDTSNDDHENLQQSVLSQESIIENAIESPTPTATAKPKVHAASATPIITPVLTPSPKPTVYHESKPANSDSSREIKDQNAIITPAEDPYIEYLYQQQSDLEKKNEDCQNLYNEITASIQPLLNTRDSLNQKYLDAIDRVNVDQVAYYQSELSRVQSEIDSAYQVYYSVCP